MAKWRNKMKELILDLRKVLLEEDGYPEWADSPVRAEIENAMLDHAGKIIRVRITNYHSKSYYKQADI